MLLTKGEASCGDTAESREDRGCRRLACAVPCSIRGDRAAQAMRQRAPRAGWSGGSVWLT